MHRIVEKTIVIATIVEARYSYRLLAGVLLLFSTDHVNFTPHLNRVVEGVDRVASVLVLTVLKLALISAAHGLLSRKEVHMSVLASYATCFFAHLQRLQVIILVAL